MGAKPGGTKGNEQQAEYENRKQGMGNQAGTNGENRESESGSGAPGKPLLGGAGKCGKEEAEG